MSTKANPSEVSDCYANAAPDEPMFVLLARDQSAPQLVELWAEHRIECGEDPRKVLEALKCAKSMRRYRYERNGAPVCEYCGSNSYVGCTTESTKLATDDNVFWSFWCGSEESHLHKEARVQTIDEYFASDDANEYRNRAAIEAMEVFHATRSMRARANEAVMGEPEPDEGPTVDDIVRTIKRNCVYWASEERVYKLLGYLEQCGKPLYDALKALPDDERRACGIDEVAVCWVDRTIVDPAELPDYGGGISGGRAQGGSPVSIPNFSVSRGMIEGEGKDPKMSTRYENCKPPEVTVRPSDGTIVKTNHDESGNIIGSEEMSYDGAKDLIDKLQAAVRSVEVLFEMEKPRLPKTGETRRGPNPRMNDAFVDVYNPNIYPPFHVTYPKGNELGDGGWYDEESILANWPEVVEMDVEAKSFPNPAKEIATLVELALSPPIMGMAGGSATEEHAIDRWKGKVREAAARLFIVCGPPSRSPELHRFLNAVAETIGYSR